MTAGLTGGVPGALCDVLVEPPVQGRPACSVLTGGATSHTAPPGGPELPQRLRIGSWVSFGKEEVFEICGALALAEVLLARLGRQAEASRMATVFDLVEAGLAR